MDISEKPVSGHGAFLHAVPDFYHHRFTVSKTGEKLIFAEKGIKIKSKMERKEAFTMLAKLTAKNQITIPKNVISKFSGVQYFDVEQRNEMIILKPVTVFDTDLIRIREKIRGIGLSEDCVSEAVQWARRK